MPDKYPIVLAHGICRFEDLINVTFGLDNRDSDGLHYFKRIRSTLIAAGFETYHSRVPWAAGVEVRAARLKDQLECLTGGFKRHERVHVIAHSMGGLDARHMIYRYRMEDRVASLSTIGTPHWGSPFADWGVTRHGWVIPVLNKLGIDGGGLIDLTTHKCRAFNERARGFEEQNGVRYCTYAGIQPRNRIFRPLRFSYDIVFAAEGINDGLVSLSSAQWQENYFVRHIDADHLNEIGWCDGSEPEYRLGRDRFEGRIQQFYVEIARRL